MAAKQALDRDLNWDALKALLLILLTLNHCKIFFPLVDQFLEALTAPLGFFSPIEPFVLLAGMATGRSAIFSGSFERLRSHLLSRTKNLYKTHLLLLGMVLFLGIFSKGLLATNPIVREFFTAPLYNGLATALLVYRLPMLDVIPLYIMLLGALYWVAKYLFNPNHLRCVLIFSFLVWLLLQFNIQGQSLLFNNFRVYNPLGYQFLFVLGFIFGFGFDKCGGIYFKQPALFFYFIDSLCFAIVIWCFYVRHNLAALSPLVQYFVDAYSAPKAQLPFLALINTLAMARIVRFFAVLNYGRWPVFLFLGNWLGRNSLLVFSWNVVFVYVLQAWSRELFDLPPSGQWILFSLTALSVAIPLFIQASFWPQIKEWHSNLSLKAPPEETPSLNTTQHTVFLVASAVLPVLYLPGFGIEYREIKFIFLWLLSSLLLVTAVRHRQKIASVPLPLAISMGGLLTIVALSSLWARNTGLVLERVATLSSFTIVFLTVFNTPRFVIKHFATALCVPVLIAVFLILTRAYAGLIVIPVGAGLGGLIGERNSCAIFLAACLPLLLMLLDSPRSSTFKNRAVLVLVFLVIVSLTLSRTRTAWLMVGLQMALMLSACLLSPRFRSRLLPVLTLYASCLAVAVVTALVLPNHLNWSSPTPYLDSVSTLFSSEHSNGRVELWQVALTMIKTNPWMGVGAGNYAVAWRSYVPMTGGVDPMVFGFLRPDLPLFNDYLQAIVETGWIGGLFFASLFLAAPLYGVYSLLKSKTDANPSTYMSLVCCVSLSLAAIFDYPLLRPETLLVFSVAAACALKSHPLSFHTVSAPRNLSPLLKVVALAMIAIATINSTSLAIRSIAHRYSPESYILHRVAFYLWPWDNHWGVTEARLFAHKRNGEFADDYIESRMSSWPFDPASSLSAAEIAMIRGEKDRSLDFYEKALFEVEGGRCHPQTIATLKKISGLPNHALSQQSSVLLTKCSQ